MNQSVRNLPNGPLTLYLATADIRLERMLRKAVFDIGFTPAEPWPKVLAITCDSTALREVTGRLCESFDDNEKSGILCHLSQSAKAPAAFELMQTCNLLDLGLIVDANWIVEFLDAQRIKTFFQPIVHVTAPNTVFGYECLLRGVEPDGKIVPPLRLLSAARHAGTLVELDQLAILSAIETTAKFGIKEAVFINIVPQHVSGNNWIVEKIIETVYRSGENPNQIVFEVTESDQIDDLGILLDVLAALREAGFRIALDDVGTGYNSLSRLTQIQPDFVKVDIELMRGVDADRFKSCVTRKLLELSRELGCKTVVEGVETVEEWQWAREQGADFAQGYLFAKPAAEPPKPELSVVGFAQQVRPLQIR